LSTSEDGPTASTFAVLAVGVSPQAKGKYCCMFHAGKRGRFMTITADQINEMQNVDIGAVDKNALADVSGVSFDTSLPQAERMARILEQVKNPYCFRHGDTAVKIEFDESGPPLQEVITNFLIRQKSGL